MGETAVHTNAVVQGILEFSSLAGGAVFFAVLLHSTWTDITEGKVYNVTVGAGIVLGLLFAYLRGGFWAGLYSVSLGSHLMAMWVGFGLFFVPYWLRGIGAGDVKLMAAIGAMTGFKFTLWTVSMTFFAGAPLAVGFLLWRRDFKSGLKRSFGSFSRLRYERETVTVGATEPIDENQVQDSPAPTSTKTPCVTDESDEVGSAVGDAPPEVKAAVNVNVKDGAVSLPEAAAEKSPESKTPSREMPYAVAICLGALWTLWLFVNRGAELPFF